MKKRVLSTLLSLLMVMTMFPTITMATESSQATEGSGAPAPWDGTTIDTSWYTEAPEGTKTFTIYTAEELAGLAKIVNSGTTKFQNMTIELGADIDLNQKHWTPIGYGKNNSPNFCGEFDGNEHVISNLYIDGSIWGNKPTGLFGMVGRGGGADRHGGYIHDFTIDGAYIEKAYQPTGVVTGSAFHDNVFENITVQNAVLDCKGSAIVGGVQSTQFKNILAKNITINAPNGGEIGGMFGSNQGAMQSSKVKYYQNKYCLPGTIISDGNDEGDGLLDNPVLINYYEDCRGEDITINVTGANSYIGGFAAYCLDYDGNNNDNKGMIGDTMICINCGIKDLEINIKSGSGIVGGFIGLRSSISNYSFTDSNGSSVTLGGFEDCYVKGSINGLGGTYAGFVGESGAHAGIAKPFVTYNDVVTDVDIAANEGARVSGFIGWANISQNRPQSFSKIEIEGETKLGGNSVPTNLIGYATMRNNGGLIINDCKADVLVGGYEGPGTITIEYKVNFETNHGSDVESIVLSYGEIVDKPEDPIREGYIFEGWYSDKNLQTEYDFSAPVIAPVTLYAKWKSTSSGSKKPKYAVNVPDELQVKPARPAAGRTVTVTIPENVEADGVRVVGSEGKLIFVNGNDGVFTFVMPSENVNVEYITEPFDDVFEEDYYHDAVIWAIANGITKGTMEDRFSPDFSCTRGQMVTFLWRAAGCPEPISDVCIFTDIDVDSYYGKAVLWAIENGITKGTSDNTFSPNAECSRAQMASFLFNAADGEAISNNNNFVDVEDDAYYAESVQWAVENGITEGTGDNKFSPDSACTRGQMVTFLSRYYAK